MRVLPSALAAAVLIIIATVQARAHEYWIEPSAYQIAPGEEIAIHLRNGEKFSGTSLIYNANDFARFEARLGETTAPIEGVLGDRPAAQWRAQQPGLHALVYVSLGDSLRYKTFEKFEKFATHKDLDSFLVEHREQGLPTSDFTESYKRFARSLVAVGAQGNADADQADGLETEIVALANPYLGGLERLPVKVLYRGAPRANAQVELFEKGPDGAVEVSMHRTNADGVAQLPIRSGRAYLADAVVMRRPESARAKASGAVWETLWASLTFAAP